MDYTNLHDWQPLSEVVEQNPQFTKPQFDWLLRSKILMVWIRLLRKLVSVITFMFLAFLSGFHSNRILHPLVSLYL